MTRLKKLLKTAMSINDFPKSIVANDVKLELLSQFDWFKDTPKEKLDAIIDSTPDSEYQKMAEDINDAIREHSMNNNIIKGTYTQELSIEIRWLLARALYVDKHSISVDLNNHGQAADPEIFAKPLMFSGTYYTARRLKMLQDLGYIYFTDNEEHEFQPIDALSEAKVNAIIKEAHEIAISRALNSSSARNIMNKIAENRLNIVTDEFWHKHGLRQ